MAARSELPRVELRGHQLDLENLAAVLRGGKHRISLEEGLCWLHSTDFEGLVSDPDRLRAKAAELLPLINGVAKGCLPGFHPVELGQCVDWIRPDGQAKRRLTGVVALQVRSAERVTAPVEMASLNGEIEDWTSLARLHGPLADVLQLWGKAHTHDWSTLYKMMEQIEEVVGVQILAHKWATKAELRRFHHTANSPAVLGHAARHGVQTSTPPANPMTIVEAQELVERLIRRWIVALKSNG